MRDDTITSDVAAEMSADIHGNIDVWGRETLHPPLIDRGRPGMIYCRHAAPLPAARYMFTYTIQSDCLRNRGIVRAIAE